MSAKNTSGTILIRADALLPAGVAVESDAFLLGWRAVRNLDGYGLSRTIEEAKWNFFYLAGEIRAIAFGREGIGSLRRAVKRALAKLKEQKFNSLEITRVVSKRFLGIPFISVATHSRHIQQVIGLVPAKDSVMRMPVAAPNKEMATKRYTALIPSS